MNYESMSDFEINKAVAEMAPLTYVIGNKGSYPSQSDDAVHVERRDFKHGQLYECGVDYCNNPSDAWPIIIENEIAIIPPISNGTNGWKAERFYNDNCGRIIDCIDKSPLRAAMIVFLMMSEK